MIAGYIYGVVLNDKAELETIGDGLSKDPYKAPPNAPVVYIKPRMTASAGGAPVPVPVGEEELVLSPTIGLIFARSVARGESNPLSAVSAMCLAIDASLPETDYYRPAIRQRCRDGFLPLGNPVPFENPGDLEISTRVDGAVVHRWSLHRLRRSVETLVADLADFMTFEAGDMLLVGLPGDAPRVRINAEVRVEATGIPPIVTRLTAEMAA